MSIKLLWTSFAVFIVASVIEVPAVAIVASVLAIIGFVLMWLEDLEKK